ncbi:cytochrome c maturation protein CcmE [Thalassotalea profundi]|uniref:Cytochrome c-type biogenesis protein CcmE n=1 Tax=Thalassotalea profundi TaxID=2036687 RepID=A0ABQ3IVD4_9GAMM|nr:cytochrome c maturation protein CcmE [Thalassotalea profundi]GHE95290.1 cytochrome c-type biogenesis protein CcmE [Thalassotalea profundi]
MNPRRKKRLTIIVSIITAIGVITGLVLYALSQNIDLFYTPSEIINGKDDSGIKPIIGQRIRVGGLVVPGSVKRDPDNLKVQFDLTNKGEMIRVKYDGILPDLFREGQGIIANGILTESRLLTASEVLAKHDENYMPKEIAESLGEGHKIPEYSEEQLNNKY